MPRAEADIAKGPCPLCGYVAGQTVAPYVDEPPPVVVPEAVAPPLELAPTRRIPSMIVGIASMAVGAALASALLPAKVREVTTVQTFFPATSIDGPASNIAAKPTPLATNLEPVREVAPFPREVGAVAFAIVPIKPVEIMLGGVQLIRLNRPEEIYTMERIGEGNTIKLVGKVSKLVVAGVDGGAMLDASELDVKTISFNGKIEGNAQIKVQSPNGTINFSKAIGGGARIEAHAPGGSVAFASPGATVSGGAKLKITGKSVWFHTRIDGGSFVEVIVSKTGGLKFFELAGGSKIHYRGEKPDDEARITPGRIDDSSECKRLD